MEDRVGGLLVTVNILTLRFLIPQETQTKGANKIIHDQEHIIIDSFLFVYRNTRPYIRSCRLL